MKTNNNSNETLKIWDSSIVPNTNSHTKNWTKYHKEFPTYMLLITPLVKTSVHWFAPLDMCIVIK